MEGDTMMARPFAVPFRGGRFQDRRGRGRGRGMGDPKDPADLDIGNPSFDGKRMRKAIHRKTVDYNASMILYLENRIFQRDQRDRRSIQPDATYASQLMPPSAMLDKPMNCVTTKFVRTSTNKFRCPVFCLAWTPEGRRLVTGASSGEFTLWNGLTFNFETILQAHDVSVRAMRWSHNDLWMVTADHGGYVKYWQSNMNNVKMYQGHKEPIRGVSFCPTDSKFATCSDDGTVRIWDFMRCQEEQIMRGHGADVKCVDWHPQKSLVASGSKDNQQPIKLWDPRSGLSLATLHAHKHTVMALEWNRNGHWLLTASRDHLLKVFDVRNMKTEMQTFKGHKKEATSLAWHPLHESLFASGGSDGSLMFWLVGCDREVGSMEEAHEGMVWSLDWHPLGHILTSGSNDHTTKFWTRNRPGDEMRDRYNLNNLPTGVEQEILEYSKEDFQAPSLPGMGLEHGLPDQLKSKEEEGESVPNIPGLDWNQDSPFFKQIAAERMPMKKIPFARPIPRSFEKAWLGQETPQSAMEKAANKPGILGIPPSLNPAMALNVLLQGGNSGNIPPDIVMNMMTEMQKQPHLMVLGQQLLMKHQQDLMQQKQGAAASALDAIQNALSAGMQQNEQQNSAQQNAAQQVQNMMQQQQKAMQQQQQSNAMPQQNVLQQQQQNLMQQQQNALQQQQNALQQQQNAMQQQQNAVQQQNAMQQQQQPRMQSLHRPALLQTPLGMRPPMLPEGQTQFPRPPAPGQPPFRPEGMGGQQGPNQFGPGGPGVPAPGGPGPGGPGQMGQARPPFPPQQQEQQRPPMAPPAKENFRPMPGQPSGPPMGDQDHRRPFPSNSTPTPTPTPGPSTSHLPTATMDTDLRRPGPAMEPFPADEGDEDFRRGPGGVPDRGRGDRGRGDRGRGDRGRGGFPPQGHRHPSQSQHQEMFEDSDMRSHPFFGQEGGGFQGDGYGDEYDFDARMGGDVDERFPPHEQGHGGHFIQEDMHGYHGGYHDNQGGRGRYMDGNQFEDEGQGRKRSWQEGPGGRGGRGARGGGGRGQDSLRGGGGRPRVYNGPAGPIEPRRGGRGRGGRGRGRGGGW